jgi:hypothetical protein
MHRAVITAIAALSLIAGAAIAKPSFTGDWKMNASKSSFGEFPAPSSLTMKIGHEDPNLKVTTTMTGDFGEFTWDAAYTTDGKECTNTMRDNESKSVLKWEGDTLLINTKGSFGGNEMTISDKWVLSEDSKTLTVERKFASSQGEMTQKIAMEKQ